MPKETKKKPAPEEQKKDAPDKASWGEDQKKHEYYYDDAHGYEIYVPEDDDDAEAVREHGRLE